MPLYGPASTATAVVSGNFQTVVAERLDGSVVILWVDRSPGANQYDVHGKVIAADGTVLVADFIVSTVAAGNQDHMAVATRASDGAFLAVWQSYPFPPGAPVTIQAQLFDAAGNRLGAEFSVSTGGVERVEIAPLADGGFMVVWESSATNAHQIKAQRLDASGAEVGSELTLYNPADFQVVTSFRLADVHQLPSGELVLSVRQEFGNIGVQPSAFVQTFDLAGNATDTPETFGREFPVLTLAPDGGFFAAYRSTSGQSVLVQRFDANAEKVGGEVTVNLVNASFASDTDIAALPDGGFLISWNGTSIAGGGEAIFAQTFTAAGVRSGPAIELTTSVGQSLVLVDITTEDDGSFELTWNAGTTLMTQRFEPQPYPASGTFTGTPNNDNLIGGEGNDIINALGGNDRLFGWTGNDKLDGGTGNDVTDGGAGDDFHIVDSQGDIVIELAGEGYDNVLASVNYVLAQNVYVEVLSTTDHGGIAEINLTGNNFANIVIGNAAKNVLDGGSGADILQGLGGGDFYLVDADDRVYEAAGGGYDNVLARTDYVLTAGSAVEVLSTTSHTGNEPLRLTGNELGQIVIGNAGNNYLDGGGGADILQGLGGNDFYFVDSDDQVIEDNSVGYDNVLARTNFVLTAGAYVEVLSTTDHAGIAAINLTGNELAQVVIGNAGANVLNGGFGDDLLQGLSGADTFAFTTAVVGPDNIDTIADFVSGTDKIALDDAVFTGLTPGALPAGAFVTGTAALDANDRIIYDSATGALYFDADGVGGVAMVQFATLTGHPVIVASDFTVI